MMTSITFPDSSTFKKSAADFQFVAMFPVVAMIDATQVVRSRAVAIVKAVRDRHASFAVFPKASSTSTTEQGLGPCGRPNDPRVAHGRTWALHTKRNVLRRRQHFSQHFSPVMRPQALCVNGSLCYTHTRAATRSRQPPKASCPQGGQPAPVCSPCNTHTTYARPGKAIPRRCARRQHDAQAHVHGPRPATATPAQPPRQQAHRT
jgi:hypothetical protein